MSIYDLEFNKDDVLIRNIIIGVLASLHDNINWYNKTGNTEKEEITIPFYFSTVGDERFLQDSFLQDVFYDPDGNIAETVYNEIPRAYVELGGIEIDSSSITQQFVRGNYDKQVEDGVLKSFSAEFIPIPIVLSLEITIIVDSTLDQFKAIESIIRNFHRDVNFQINCNGIRLPASFALPDSTTQERTIEFRSGTTEKKENKITFSIDAQVLYPVFKNDQNGFKGAKNTELFRGNVMRNLSVIGATPTSNIYIDSNIQNESITSNQDPTSDIPVGENSTIWPLGGTAAGQPLPPH